MPQIRTLQILLLLWVLSSTSASSAQTSTPGEKGEVDEQAPKHWAKWRTVKIAAAQVSIHTGTEGNEMVAFIDRAGSDRAQLIVLGEYILGTFPSHAPTKSERVRRVSEASRRIQIYVVVGGWEEFEPGAHAALKPRAFANTAIVFGRDGKIIGRYRKTHGAVGGTSPHCWPPLATDHEWGMREGDSYPTFSWKVYESYGHVEPPVPPIRPEQGK